MLPVAFVPRYRRGAMAAEKAFPTWSHISLMHRVQPGLYCGWRKSPFLAEVRALQRSLA
jgi:hypothetical protein